MKNTYLLRGTALIGALLSAFGGFLLNVAPPDETGAKFAVGISSLVALVGFLFVSSLVQKNATEKTRNKWRIAAAFLAVGFITSIFTYHSYFNALTFLYPPDDIKKVRYVNGTVLTDKAADIFRKDPSISRADLLDQFGENNRHDVWIQDSIDSARKLLVSNYVLVVVSLCLTIFCFTESLLVPRRV
jgi:hypothetical protein